MTKQEFFGVMDENNLKVLGCSEITITLRNPSTKRLYSISTAHIPELEQQELIDLTAGRREIVELLIVTRVIGYYSATANWNKSKIGELADRRKGNYNV